MRSSLLTSRRLQRWAELKPLLRTKPAQSSRREQRLQAAQTIGDLREIAYRRTPQAVFDYTDGAAESEITLRRTRDVFRDLEFKPSILRDVSHVDTSAWILGRRSAQPFAFAPTGFTRLMQHEGETAVARVAERYDIPYALSALGTTSLEDVAATAPGARKWFQLYVWKDRMAAEEMVKRAQDAGYEALILTVDVPVAGSRLRDARNGLTIPPALTASTIAGIAVHPRWWFNLLTADPLEFANLRHWGGDVSSLINQLFDSSMTIIDLEWVRSIWDGPLVIKGIQTVEDAYRVVDAGADGIVVSNHGGRQLDRAPVPLRVLPNVVEEVGHRVDVWVDTGVMSGADVVAAIALGAKAVLIGRAYLYGLMAGGEQGVQRAVDILSTEVRRTLQLLGVTALSELTPDHVRLP